MAKRRVSMRGMGADAFFSPPSEEKEESVPQDESTPANQLTDKPVSQQVTMPALQDTVVPTKQQDSIPIQQSTIIPASQEAIIPIKQESTMSVSQQDVIPVSQQSSTPDKQEFIKATYYIRPEQDIALEQIRLHRRLKGEKIDKSALIREMIDRFTKEENI